MHISDDPEMAGKHADLFSIDCPKFSAKLRVGDKITLDYGTVELRVRGFMSKAAYLENYNRTTEEDKGNIEASQLAKGKTLLVPKKYDSG